MLTLEVIETNLAELNKMLAHVAKTEEACKHDRTYLQGQIDLLTNIRNHAANEAWRPAEEKAAARGGDPFPTTKEEVKGAVEDALTEAMNLGKPRRKRKVQ